MYDVLYLVNEAGYRLENLNPTAEGYYFAWDSEGQKMVYIREDLDTIIYPEDYTIDKSKCWITVGDKAEAERVAQAGYNLYLEKNIDLIELHNVAVSIDTGAFKLGSLIVDGQLADSKSVVLSGNFGDTTLDIGNTSFSTTGTVSNLNIGSNTAAMTIKGNVSTLSSSISNTSMSSTGIIGSVASGTSVVINNQTYDSTSTNISGAVNGVVTTSTKEDIENIRTQIAGGRTFEGETVSLSNDINMAGIAFQPISNYDRFHLGSSNTKWFQGTFDGQNHTIKNFSTNGFSIAGLNAGTNDTSVTFGSTTYSEANYGLLGAVYVKEGEEVIIKDLTIEAAIDMVVDDANKFVGDSVGGLIGFAFGAGTITIKNVTINGSVTGYDGVSAFIGRAYGISADNANKNKAKYVPELGYTDAKAHYLTVVFDHCTNNATVTSVRKAGAFLGTSSNVNSSFINVCTNNGNIWSKGIAEDQSLGAKNKDGSQVTGENGKAYYQAGIIMDNGTVARTTVDGVTNNGTIKVG